MNCEGRGFYWLILDSVLLQDNLQSNQLPSFSLTLVNLSTNLAVA